MLKVGLELSKLYNSMENHYCGKNEAEVLNEVVKECKRLIKQGEKLPYYNIIIKGVDTACVHKITDHFFSVGIFTSLSYSKDTGNVTINVLHFDGVK